jgi:hypothetical protein
MPQESLAMSHVRTLLARAALAGAALAALAGCAGTPRNPEVEAATPGVTVYGTADAGVGRIGR